MKRSMVVRTSGVIFAGTAQLALALAPVAPVHAAVSDWTVSEISLPASIEQLETTPMTFAIENIEEESLRSGTFIAGAGLVPVDPLPHTTHGLSSGRGYACYDPAPKSLLGNTGGTALSPKARSGTNRIRLTFSCTFPRGMLVSNYRLVISGWISGAAGSKAPTVIPTTAISRVVRNQPQLPNSYLEISERKLTEMQRGLNSRISSETQLWDESSRRLAAATKQLAGLQTELKALLVYKSALQTRYLQLRGDIGQVTAALKNAENALEGGRIGFPSEDIETLYLQAIPFVPTSKPEILQISIPTPPADPLSSTPYIQLIVRSESPIIGMACCSHFSGNVLVPGQTPVSDSVGGGLILIADQSAVQGMVVSTLLVRAKYLNGPPGQWDSPQGAWKAIQDLIDDRRMEVAFMGGRVVDAAYNNSIDLCYVNTSTTCQPWSGSPLPVQTTRLDPKLFDRLLQTYQDLANLNKRVMQLKQPKIGYDLLANYIQVIETKLMSLSTQVKELRRESQKKATTVLCVKGQVTKIVTALNPKCPEGFKKR